MSGADDRVSGDGWAVVADDGLVLIVNLPESEARRLASPPYAKSGDDRAAVPNHLAMRLGRERQRLADLAQRELRRAQREAARATLAAWQRELADDLTGGRAERPYQMSGQPLAWFFTEDEEMVA